MQIFFGVSPSWLIGNPIVNSSDDYESTPERVFSRVYYLLLDKTGIPNSDYHQVSEEQGEMLFAPVAGIVSKYDLLNWEHNRIHPNIKQIEALAKHFNCTFEFIAHGIREDLPEQDYKNEQLYRQGLIDGFNRCKEKVSRLGFNV